MLYGVPGSGHATTDDPNFESGVGGKMESSQNSSHRRDRPGTGRLVIFWNGQ